MILTTHTLVGAAIGKTIGNPWLIIPLSLSAHFFFDSFRHGEYLESFDGRNAARKGWWKIALDLTAGLLIVALAAFFGLIPPDDYLTVAIGIFFSLFPDLFTLIYWKWRMPFFGKIYAFHAWVHKYPPFSPERTWTLRNASNDILISILALFFILAK